MSTTATERKFNFSAGPAVLPEPVLEQIRDEMLALPGAYASVLEISHRSKPFKEIIGAAEANLRKLLSISDDYAVLFLQGGSRLQFSAIAMNLMTEAQQSADYILTGTWGKGAQKEAAKVGAARTAWDGSADNFIEAPADDALDLDPNAAYVHYTCNETIQGVQFPTEPATGGVPLICDASSDFLHKPLDVSKYGLIYACAQKNAGPAGVTMVIVRKDLLERSQDSLPIYINYREQAEAGSLLNTAPTFAIYVVRLVTDWLLNEIGGLVQMHEQNKHKAGLLYGVLDDSPGFYTGHARRECRSLMNVTFTLPSDELTKKFLAEADDEDLTALGGHRSVGGVRASIYNAMPLAGVECLRDFMIKFRDNNG
ncbi:MAG: 3-phosphoserine/phosphohydroxythreonine transaminase [Planctomycetota bacterium]